MNITGTEIKFLVYAFIFMLGVLSGVMVLALCVCSGRGERLHEQNQRKLEKATGGS